MIFDDCATSEINADGGHKKELQTLLCESQAQA